MQSDDDFTVSSDDETASPIYSTSADVATIEEIKSGSKRHVRKAKTIPNEVLAKRVPKFDYKQQREKELLSNSQLRRTDAISSIFMRDELDHSP
jgi:hypothetical protein